MLILSTSRTFCPECHDPYCVGRCTNPRKISNSYCAMTFPELSNLCVIYQGHGLSRLPGAGCLVWIDMLDRRLVGVAHGSPSFHPPRASNAASVISRGAMPRPAPVNLSPPSHPAPILTSPRPRGAAIRRYAVGGAGAAPAGGVTTHSREASGHRPGGTTAPVRGAR